MADLRSWLTLIFLYFCLPKAQSQPITNPTACENLLSQLHPTQANLNSVFDHLERVDRKLTARERDVIVDFVEKSKINENDFVDTYNQLQKEIPTKDIHALLFLISIKKNTSMSTKDIVGTIKSTKELIETQIKKLPAKAMGFQNQNIEGLSWDESVYVFKWYSTLLSKNPKIKIEQILSWSIANGAENKKSLLETLEILSVVSPNWSELEQSVPKIRSITFSKPTIGFNSGVETTHATLTEAIVIHALFLKSGHNLSSLENDLEKLFPLEKLKAALI